MGTRSEEKWELVDFNDRFQTYVQRVRKLKDESDLESFYLSIKTLEEEIKNMKTSYEGELAKTRYSVEMLTKEKSELERDIIVRKNTEAHLSDRLNVEIERSNRLMEEVSTLQKSILVKDTENRDLSTSIQQGHFDYNTLKKDSEDDKKTIIELKRFSENSTTAYADAMAKIKILEDKLNFQENFHEERTVELRQRLESTQLHNAELENRLEEANRKEREFPEQLQRAHAVAAEEMKQFQVDTENFYKSTLDTLNTTIEEERAQGRNMQGEIDRLNMKVVELRTESTELRAQTSSLDQQKLILEQTLENERHQANHTINSMERKLKEVQEMMAQKLQEASVSREAHISLRAELDALRGLIDEEEKRLEIHHTQHAPQVTALPPLAQNQLTTSIPKNPVAAPVVQEVSTVVIQEKQVQEVISEEQSQEQVEFQLHRSEKVENLQENGGGEILVGEEELLVAAGERVQKEDSVPALPVVNSNVAEDVPLDLARAIEEAEATELNKENTVEVEQYPPGQSPRNLPAAGPITSPRPVVGPIRTKSAPSSSRTEASIGDTQDYHEAMFHDANLDYQRQVEAGVKRPNSAVQHDVTNATSSSTGDLKILEVHPQGQYIRVWNANDRQEVDFGNYSLQQNVSGHPVALFRFPGRTKLGPNSTVTVWAACNEDPAGCHRPPSDFYWPEQMNWGAGPECTTVLCKPNGEPIAWTTPNLRFVKDNFAKVEERSFRGSSSTLEGNDPTLGAEKLPELPSPEKNQALFVRRDRHEPVYAVGKHPHGHQPKAQVHPAMGQQRSQLLGNDNSSINRQARSQITNVPDPIPGEPYAGVSNQRLASARLLRYYPGILLPSGAINNRSPEVLLRSCLDSPSPFQPPHVRFDRGMRQIRSVQDIDHHPPLPRKQPLVSEW